MTKSAEKWRDGMPASPVKSFDSIVSTFLLNFAKNLTLYENSSKRGLYKYARARGQMTKEQYHYRLALQKPAKTIETNGDAILIEIGKDATQVLGDQIASSIKVMKDIQANFDFDFNIFGGSRADEDESPAKPPLIRYSVDERQNVVMTKPSQDELATRGRAEKQRQIEDEKSWEAQELHSEEELEDLDSDTQVAQTSSSSIFNKVPSTAFKVKLAPERRANVASLSTQINQADGLYSLTINRTLSSPTMTKRHVFTVPFFLNMKGQRVYIDNMHAERTSLIDIKHHALSNYVVNVHYWHLKSFYTCDIGYTLKQKHRFLVELKMSKLFQPAEYGGDANGQYKLSYNFNF